MATTEEQRTAAINHMMSVLADPKATAARKDRMAALLIQYSSASVRGVPPSKRTKTDERAERARDAGERFAARTPPKLCVVKSA